MPPSRDPVESQSHADIDKVSKFAKLVARLTDENRMKQKKKGCAQKQCLHRVTKAVDQQLTDIDFKNKVFHLGFHMAPCLDQYC